MRRRPFGFFYGFFLFILGIAFGYFIVFPLTFETLMSFGVENIEATISLKDYILLASKVLVFLGFAFQLPNVLLILGFMGIVTKYSLRNMRRYIYVLFAIVSAMLTPPDVFTMMGLWLPLVLLFEVGIVAVASIVHPYLERHHIGKGFSMILVTGGAGFIGSVLVNQLNQRGHDNIIIIDRLESDEKWRNLQGKRFREYIHADQLFLEENEPMLGELKAIFHMGACSSTTERNVDFLMDNNVYYSRALFTLATELDIPFIYASSASNIWRW